MGTTISGANVQRVATGGPSFGDGSNRGMYATACENSPNRQQIDIWLNEGKSCAWISKQLEALGEKISDKSVAKYKDYRDQWVQEQLAQDPKYQAKIQGMNQAIVDSTSKIREIDVLKHISDTIEQSATLINAAMELDDEGRPKIKIKNATDLRMIQMTMLDCIRLYGDTVMKMQKFAKVEADPSLLRPGNSDEIKQVVGAILEVLPDDVRFAVIDKLRAGTGILGV